MSGSPLLPPDETPDARIRRRRAFKQVNERLKLLSGALNGLAVATMIAGVVLPYLGGRSQAVIDPVLVLLGAIMLHGVAHAILTLWKSED